MKNLLNQHPESEIVILSGEGEIGTYELYAGTRTERAIKSRLTKEKCHGDRWAKAYIYLHESETGSVYVNLENADDMRHIDKANVLGK